MLGNLISFNGAFHKSVKKLLKYIEVNNPSKEELDELRDQFVENAILDIERTHGTKEIKGFESIEEIKKHLIRPKEDKCNSKQLSQIAIEHSYAKSRSVDENNNIINVPDVKVKFNEPRSGVYGLRDVEKIKEKNCICCNSQ